MADLKIVIDDLSGLRIAQFLNDHIEEMKAVTRPGASTRSTRTGLRKPEVTFWVVGRRDP